MSEITACAVCAQAVPERDPALAGDLVVCSVHCLDTWAKGSALCGHTIYRGSWSWAYWVKAYATTLSAAQMCFFPCDVRLDGRQEPDPPQLTVER